ncbi:MAG: protease modulator HflK N-terminal domain-containing protein, partial [Burkholderiaceae bacterium]|nr:protease modulator HflK N-terminal domain-containing protein [Burkholderiaceae bacterium]
MTAISRLTNRPGIFARLVRVFNLNGSDWGRGENDKPKSDQPSGSDEERQHDNVEPIRPSGQGGSSQRPRNQDGPPDLDELWRDFNQRLGGLFGGSNGRNGNG